MRGCPCRIVTDDPQHGEKSKVYLATTRRDRILRELHDEQRTWAAVRRRKRKRRMTPDFPKMSPFRCRCQCQYRSPSRPVFNECLITTVRLSVTRENKCNIVLKCHCCVCRFAFLLVRHCVNLVKGVNDVFPAPISRDYRRGDIEGHMTEFILCWCNTSPPLKGSPGNDFSTVHVRQRDNAFFRNNPKLRRQRCSRVYLIFRCGKSLLVRIQAH